MNASYIFFLLKKGLLQKRMYLKRYDGRNFIQISAVVNWPRQPQNYHVLNLQTNFYGEKRTRNNIFTVEYQAHHLFTVKTVSRYLTWIKRYDHAYLLKILQITCKCQMSQDNRYMTAINESITLHALKVHTFASTNF